VEFSQDFKQFLSNGDLDIDNPLNTDTTDVLNEIGNNESEPDIYGLDNGSSAEHRDRLDTDKQRPMC
jgi:hypothetical protein